MIRICLLLSLFLTQSLYAKGGGVGNGGDALFCTWRKALTLDYYGIGFSGGVYDGRISQVQDLYKEKLSLDRIVLEVLSKSIKLAHSDMIFFGTTRKDLKRLRRKVSQGLKKYFNYRDWNLKENIPKIDDSFHDYFLPKGCMIKQVAQFINNKVNVNKNLFNQLDYRQKEFLALHEAIYWAGRKYFKHQNSYLTRNLIRAVMRKTKDPKDQELYLAASLFIKNKLPKTTSGLKENTPGSAPFYSWSLNLMDLEGDFILRDKTKDFCPSSIHFSVDNDLSFKGYFKTKDQKLYFSDNDLFTKTTKSLKALKEKNIIDISKKDLSQLNLLISRDRPLWFKYQNKLSFVGLNQKDQLYFISKRGKTQCLYERPLP